MLEREQHRPLRTTDAAPEDLDQASPGNRPAQNARQVDGTGQVEREWRGNEGATDFLGLDPAVRGEFAGYGAPAATAAEASSGAALSDHSAATATDPSNSWLMGLSGGQSPLTGGVDADALNASLDAVLPESTEVLDASELEAADALEDELSEPAPVKPWLGVYLVRGFAALAIAGLGVAFYAMYSSSQVDEPASELSNATQPRPRTTPPTAKVGPTHAAGASTDASDAGPQLTSTVDHAAATTATNDPLAPTLSGSELASNASTLSNDDFNHGTEEPRPGSERLESWTRTHAGGTWPTLEPAAGSTATPLADATSAALDPSAANDALAVAARTSAVDGELPGDAPVIVVSNPDSLNSAPATKPKPGKLRLATPDDLAGLWEGSTIPMEAIDAGARVLTPGVGRVRAILKGGEIFEGRLYAVGQKMIWLDNDLGRMALLESQLEKIQQLSSPQGTPALGEQGSQELVGIPRVRVRTPGGMFYGKTLARTDKTITLITDEGARVTLESTDVEPAPLGRSVIVKGKL